MAGDDKEDPWKALKELAVDSMGIPPGGSVLGSPFLKGLLAGYVVSKLRAVCVVGVLLGTVTGVYVGQSYPVARMESTAKDCLDRLKTFRDRK